MSLTAMNDFYEDDESIEDILAMIAKAVPVQVLRSEDILSWRSRKGQIPVVLTTRPATAGPVPTFCGQRMVPHETRYGIRVPHDRVYDWSGR